MEKHDLALLFTQQRDEFIEHLASIMQGAHGTIYESMTDAQRVHTATLLANAVVDDFDGTEGVEEFARRISLVRVRDPNYNPQSVQEILSLINISMQWLVKNHFTEFNAEREQALDYVDDFVFRDVCACYNTYTMERERALQDSAQEQDRLIDILRELSSPIMPVHDSILVLPIVGAIDTRRAQIIMEDLLEAIVSRQADIVIIDITGVPLVDTAIANYLIQTTKAVHLLGAQVFLVGISAEVAQTLTSLQLDLSSLTVRANLQDGINHALEIMGLQICEFEDAV